MILFFNILSIVSLQAQERDRWLNWVDYIAYHPDYRQHKEPQDIANKGCSWGTWVTFPNKIEAIAAKVKNWDDPTALFQSLDFVAIYKHPGHYYEHCLEYLADPRHPEDRKAIVIYAMEQHGDWLARACYKLYQKKQFSEELLLGALGAFTLLRIHPLVIQDQYDASTKQTWTDFLKQVQTEVGAQTPIDIHIKTILSGQLARKWRNKRPNSLLHYRDKPLVATTIHQATKEYERYIRESEWARDWQKLNEAELAQERGEQQYLMLLEHIDEYMFLGSNDGDDAFFSFLKDPYSTNEEKRIFIFAMYRIEARGGIKNTLRTHKQGVNNLFDRACWYYRTGNLALPLLEELFYSSIPLDYPISLDREEVADYPRYPFFVTSYKSAALHEALDQFIALPTIPCGWKDLAKRLKKGTLLSKKDMKYLEGYQEFIDTHFILYDTIPPKK